DRTHPIGRTRSVGARPSGVRGPAGVGARVRWHAPDCGCRRPGGRPGPHRAWRAAHAPWSTARSGEVATHGGTRTGSVTPRRHVAAPRGHVDRQGTARPGPTSGAGPGRRRGPGRAGGRTPTGPRGHVGTWQVPTRKRPGPCVPARAVSQVTRALATLDAVRLPILPHDALGVFDSHSQPVHP